MPNARPVCPAALAVISRGIARLERTGAPDPDAARELLRLARAVELDTGDPSPAVPWLIRYLADCRLVAT
jgi:hypothetical protein